MKSALIKPLRIPGLLTCAALCASHAVGQLPMDDPHFLGNPPLTQQTFRFVTDAAGDSWLSWRAHAGWLYRATRSTDGLAWLPLQDHYQAGLPGSALTEAQLHLGAVTALPPGLASAPPQRTIQQVSIQSVAGTALWPNAGTDPSVFRFGAWVQFRRAAGTQIFPGGQTTARVRARVLLPTTINGTDSYRWSPLMDATLSNP